MLLLNALMTDAIIKFVYRIGLSILSLLVIIVLYNVQQLNGKLQEYLMLCLLVLFNVRFTLFGTPAVKILDCFGNWTQLWNK